MTLLGKKLHIRKGAAVRNISLYSKTAEVGAAYISLRVDSQVCYAQLTTDLTDPDISELRVRKGGQVYAAKAIASEPGLITGKTNPAAVVGAPTPAAGTYWWQSSGGWYIDAAWVEPSDTAIVEQFQLDITPHITLDACHHFRLKWGTSISCVSDGGTIPAAQRQFKAFTGAPGTYYFKVQAEDTSNNVLFSSAVVSLASALNTRASLGLVYDVYRYDSTASGEVLGQGNLATGNSHININLAEGSTSKRFFKVRSRITQNIPAGDLGYRASVLACADTCSCNCNYCTCNCNYCTCNCNYCPCNCDYSPCGCSSGN